jgi:hypothetical protein
MLKMMHMDLRAWCGATAVIVWAVAAPALGQDQTAAPQQVQPDTKQNKNEVDQRPVEPLHLQIQQQQLNQQRFQQQLLEHQLLQLQQQRQAVLQQQEALLESAGAQLRPELPSADELRSLPLEPQFLADVQLLADPSFEVREQATQRILKTVGDRREVYAVLCTRSDLNAEQRYRLLNIVQEHLIRMPRGALGIQSNQMIVGIVQPNAGPADPIGVRVDNVLPGLPAERVLRIGDRITHIDGAPVNQMNELQVRVQLKRPGDKVTLRVQRAKLSPDGQPLRLAPGAVAETETVEIQMELGSTDLLKAVGGPRNVASPSLVETSRAFEANEAMSRYSPQPVEIPVQGGPEALANLFAKVPTKPNWLDEYDPSAVERHPAIRELLRDRQRLAEARLPVTQSMREAWSAKWSELQQQVQRPGLPLEKQLFLQAVINRYAQLMTAD